MSQRRNDAHIIPLPLKQPIIEFRKLAPYFFSLTLLDWFGLKCDIVFGGDFFEQFASHFNEISQKNSCKLTLNRNEFEIVFGGDSILIKKFPI